MAKRKLSLPVTGGGRPEKRPKSASNTSFDYDEDEWEEEKLITYNVTILANASDPTSKIVKKVLKVNDDDYDEEEPLPFEVEFIRQIPICNRIVRPIAHSPDDPYEGFGTALFEYYPLGDIAQWRAATLKTKDFDMVPEIYIWRFFLQMAQALALLQNHIGPNRKERRVLLHRDIKPKNVLVVDNGSAHPSFRLHDFGCAKVWDKSMTRLSTYVGTYEWQPPENPVINTKAADVWALGACVHFLANGKCPIESRSKYTAKILAGRGGHPKSAEKYKRPERYYAARVPRLVIPINLSPDEQRANGYGPSVMDGREIFHPMYSDELNMWMKECLSVSPSKRPTAKCLVDEMGLEARRMLYRLGGSKALVDMEINFESEN